MDNATLARRRRFEVLAVDVYEPVQRYIRRRVEPDSIDDVVSETMLTLWRRLDDVPAGAELPWAYGVARRQIANHRRGAQRRLRLVRRMEAEPPPVFETGNPLDPELDAALASLGDADRELLRLWAWEELEPAEIAVVMGLTPNAVSIRLHRTKRKLGQNLKAVRKDEVPSGHSHPESKKKDRSWPTS